MWEFLDFVVSCGSAFEKQTDLNMERRIQHILAIGEKGNKELSTTGFNDCRRRKPCVIIEMCKKMIGILLTQVQLIDTIKDGRWRTYWNHVQQLILSAVGDDPIKLKKKFKDKNKNKKENKKAWDGKVYEIIQTYFEGTHFL